MYVGVIGGVDSLYTHTSHESFKRQASKRCSLFTVSDFVHFGGFISTHGAVVDTLLPHFILSDAQFIPTIRNTWKEEGWTRPLNRKSREYISKNVDFGLDIWRPVIMLY